MNIVGEVSGVRFSGSDRKIKLIVSGSTDARETDDVCPPGIDSSPISGMRAIYADTQVEGEEILIGYINDNEKAASGEVRLYSQDDNGNQKFYAWLKKDGTCEIGGDQDFMVRYSKLEEAFNELKSKFNALVAAFNAHTHVLTLSSGTGTAAPPAAPANQSQADISGAKISEIKTTSA